VLNNSAVIKDLNKDKDITFNKISNANDSEIIKINYNSTNNKMKFKKNLKDLQIDVILAEENNKYKESEETALKKDLQKQNSSKNDSLEINNKVSNRVIIKEKNNESIDEPEIEDEYKEKSEGDNNSVYNKSVISSNILTHINTPKLFATIKNDSSSVYTKSESSRLDTLNNDFGGDRNYMNSKPFAQTLKTSTEYTEFEMINENHRYIETPKSTSILNNPNLKTLYDKKNMRRIIQ